MPIDGTQVNNVQLGGALNFESGKNIQLSAGENGSIVVNTKDDVKFNNVEANTVNTNSLTTKSITVGKTVIDEKQVSINNKITNVHPGEVSETSTDAVNGSQLYQTNQRVTNLEGNVAKLGSRVNKVGANAAALAALHPMDFDPDDKLSFAAGAGNYGGENAMAIGMFYRPSEKVMLSAGGSMGNGENMVNMGVAFALDRPNVSNTKVAMAKEIVDLREHIDRQDQQISQLMTAVSTLTGQVIDNRGKDFFPDVPENHWAYEYIKGLFDEGIIEGYPDGMFSGERTCTRYEFAAMLYRALKKGVNLDSRIMSEFQPELSRIRVDRIYGDICDRDKVERVRVNLSKDTDHYGSKCK